MKLLLSAASVGVKIIAYNATKIIGNSGNNQEPNAVPNIKVNGRANRSNNRA